MDNSCVIWEQTKYDTSCPEFDKNSPTQQGSCLIYDNSSLSRKFLILFLSTRVIAGGVLFVLHFIVTKEHHWGFWDLIERKSLWNLLCNQ